MMRMGSPSAMGELSPFPEESDNVTTGRCFNITGTGHKTLAVGTMDEKRPDAIVTKQKSDAEKRKRTDVVVDTSHGLRAGSSE
jgi:hypothetical protein